VRAAVRIELGWKRRAVDVAERKTVRAADCKAITENAIQSINGSFQLQWKLALMRARDNVRGRCGFDGEKLHAHRKLRQLPTLDILAPA